MVSFLNSWNDVNRTLSHYFLPLCSSSTVPVLCFIHHHNHYLPSGVQFTRSLCQLSVLDMKQNKNTQNIHIFESHKPFRLAITKPSRAPHMLCCMRPSNGRGWWANHPVHHHHHRINLWQATAYLFSSSSSSRRRWVKRVYPSIIRMVGNVLSWYFVYPVAI